MFEFEIYPHNGKRGPIKFYKLANVPFKEDARVIALKSMIKAHNDHEKTLPLDDRKYLRISIMGRGPRRDHRIKVMGPYGRYRSPLWHRNADCNLQHKYAKYFDIYVHEDHNRLYNELYRERIK